MAFIFRSLGSEVVLVEKMERVLWGQDHDVAALITREFKKKGVRLLAGTALERIAEEGGRARAFLSNGETIEADRVMIGVGRRPNTEALNLAAVGVTTGSRGEILVDDRMETSAKGIFAAGDVLAKVMLSSMAVVEARIAAGNALGRPGRMDYSCAPWGIYTDPEIGSVGVTEEKASAGGIDVVIGRCGYSDLVRSCLDGNVLGLFKLIFERSSGKLIGAHIVGADASEIIHFAALAVRTGARPRTSRAWSSITRRSPRASPRPPRTRSSSQARELSSRSAPPGKRSSATPGRRRRAWVRRNPDTTAPVVAPGRAGAERDRPPASPSR